MPAFLSIIVLLAALTTVVSGVRLFAAWRAHVRERNETWDTLCIRVSKTNEKLPIVAEQMFAVLHGTYDHIGFFEWLTGRRLDRLSFEIAHVDGLVKFFVSIPHHLREYVEAQIYAQYPDVEIELVKDYVGSNVQSIRDVRNENHLEQLEQASNASDQTSSAIEHFKNVYGAELTQTDPEIYPIKRHSQFEDKLTRTAVDPLAGITAALSRLPASDDRAMIQMVIQPINPEVWRVRATKCARILGKNIFLGIERLQKWYAYAFMTRKTWPRVIFFPLYVVMFFQGLFAGAKMHLATEGGGDESILEETSSSKHDTETGLNAMMDKVVKLPFDVSIRVVYIPAQLDKKKAETKIRELAGSFKQFNLPHLNGFKIAELGGKKILERFRARTIGDESMVLNTEELATVYHLPNDTVKTPNVYWVSSKKLEPPVDLPNPEREKETTALGTTNYRGVEKQFGIRLEDRRRHVYVIGKTGMGKSTLLENMIVSDIRAGRGVAIVDPHGDLCEHVLDNIPSNRTNDVIVFDPSDRDHPVAFNMLENIDPTMSTIVASGLVGIFKKIYAESWGPRLEHILRNTILSLLEYPNTTMLGIPRILVDEEFRRRVVRKISDPIVKKFWEDEFEKMRDQQRVEAISPIQNKVGQFLSSPIIRNIVGQPKSQIDLRFAMDTKKIFVCNLSKGKIGEDNSSLLGSMIITKFQLDAMSRANIPEKDRVDFYLYVDEFQNFATDSFATILSEARKYRLNLTMANQYVAQMEEEVQEAVFGNVGTIMSFQVGADDADYLSNQFGGEEVVAPGDFVQLPKYNLYTKLLVDGMPTPPFSAATLAPVPNAPDEARREKVIALSRERYAEDRTVVEDKIRRWSETSDRDDDTKSSAKKTEAKKDDVSKKEPVVETDKLTEVKVGATVANLPSPITITNTNNQQPSLTAIPRPHIPAFNVAPHLDDEDDENESSVTPTKPMPVPTFHVAPHLDDNDGDDISAMAKTMTSTSTETIETKPIEPEKSDNAWPTFLRDEPVETETPSSTIEKTAEKPVISTPPVTNIVIAVPTATPITPPKTTPASTPPMISPIPKNPTPLTSPSFAQPLVTPATKPLAPTNTWPQSFPAQPTTLTAPQPIQLQPQPQFTAQSTVTPNTTTPQPQSPVFEKQTPSPTTGTTPLTPEQQTIVEQYTIYYQQYYHLPPTHARAAALHAFFERFPQALAPTKPTPQPMQFATPTNNPRPIPVEHPATSHTPTMQSRVIPQQTKKSQIPATPTPMTRPTLPFAPTKTSQSRGNSTNTPRAETPRRDVSVVTSKQLVNPQQPHVISKSTTTPKITTPKPFAKSTLKQPTMRHDAKPAPNASSTAKAKPSLAPHYKLPPIKPSSAKPPVDTFHKKRVDEPHTPTKKPDKRK